MLSLRDRLAFEPETWQPAPGDMVTGEVVDVKEIEGKFDKPGETHPFVDILTDREKLTGVRWFAGHTVAKNEVRKQGVRPGDQIGVKYLGKVTKNGNTYEGWRVVVEHTGPVPTPATVTANEPEIPSGTTAKGTEWEGDWGSDLC